MPPDSEKSTNVANMDEIEPVRERNHQGLGTLRLRHQETQEILLIPTPSDDPNDPLNWPLAYKYYVAVLASMAILFSTAFTGGPGLIIPDMTITFFGPPGPSFLNNVAKTSYLVTVPALMMGVSNLIWVPLMIKLGRRPVYIISFLLYAAMSAWAASAKTYGSMVAARSLMGFTAGSAEVLGPLTIADIFFVHQRGTMMAIYSFTLSIGVCCGTILAGLITIDHSWRLLFWVAVALNGGVATLMIFTFPETYYVRNNAPSPLGDGEETRKENESDDHQIENVAAGGTRVVGKRPRLAHILRTTRTGWTREPVWQLVLRPVVLIILPAVLWASLVLSVLIGFLVALTSNFSVAYTEFYQFKTWQQGLCWISGIVGAFIGIFFGGYLSDICADYLTVRNNGIREPEMRLPAIAIAVICAPLSFVIYGVGIGNHMSWIVPVIGIGLLNFSIVQATNITIVYMIDCYRPIAEEVTVTQYAFKSLLGFLLSFYTNPWIAKSGYGGAFGEMAGIMGIVLLGAVPFYFFGKPLRKMSWKWPIVRKIAHWDVDREVGE